MAQLNEFVRGDEAVTAVEYAVMLALILVTAMVSIRVLGGEASELWQTNSSELKTRAFD